MALGLGWNRLTTSVPGYRPVSADASFLLGARDLDPPEAALLASVGRANSLPVPGGLSAEQLTAAIAAIRSRTQLGAAAIASYAPEYDRKQGICRAAFAAVDAILGA